MHGGVAAIVVAGGRGTRAGGGLPKQYRCVGGMPVVRRTLLAFTAHPGIALVQPVIHRDDEALFREASSGLDVLQPAHGGATRQSSVRAGLEALAERAPEIVLVHDAARPFATPALLDRAIEAGRAGAAIPGLVVSDTVKAVDGEGRVVETLDRNRLRTVQTPQAFRFDALLAAHRKAAAAGRDDFTDDAALAEWAGLPVGVFAGEAGNVKLTTADDFRRAESDLLAALGDVRVGSGYDVHAFAEDGDHVWLGGVKIPNDRGVVGHSDADVALHALVDAILGALAEGDIGVHFPPSDEQWRGASSDRFVAYAVERVRARGGRIAHVDITVVAETPRLGPHREAIRARVAEITGIPVERVGLQATTSEKMGFIGRREGLVAYATATVRLPWGAE
ncbi:2-C-methyl-D-erythritol 4-phosphate cytidylyltransferase [Rhodovulum sp. PH10]|uniref:bifunctional 2-C-methyl-D-erythritol 4-phosphate cytidylyltransferase/2-C-methyl-D-erythritol 2,4-cyclodiphosphate synthase n=1 Tax=Rhodovulum sp. PH10 TaxID=1187851 RepID=UPI00027C264C|nr:bifunctional 2-C-methyl-D-erythritol 4-phosphate cytidylyltransferase/2-C-methyl-D-erythritol 2,4-cyclodiphosphate synthase [Rhodovulum sp. PH10]EJW12127.1 2-C-methyl-D-erythritol 4-phosphate cytidylyltransferase [Rhodovulum sp. PH10]